VMRVGKWFVKVNQVEGIIGDECPHKQLKKEHKSKKKH